jgi:8-oxo-(d)GTP phosphatase
MKIFINDIPLNIVKANDPIDLEQYEYIIDGAILEDIEDIKFKDDVLVREASTEQIEALLKHMKNSKLKKLDSITVTVDDHKSVKHFVKSKFKIIKAAGGLVRKDDKVLLIHRLEKWDLPKGKLDKNESPADGALREVEEECNVKVALGEKICSTWHTYSRNGKRILKKTTWYAMECLDDSKMAPQLEEDIDAVQWMNPREIRNCMYNSYPSIRHVFHEYYKLYAVEY